MVCVFFVNAVLWPSSLSVVGDGGYGEGGGITMALNKLDISAIDHLLPADPFSFLIIYWAAKLVEIILANK